jgi:hypothetical protein
MPDAVDIPFYRGSEYQKLGKMDLACLDFGLSAKRGYPLGVEAYKNSCK